MYEQQAVPACRLDARYCVQPPAGDQAAQRYLARAWSLRMPDERASCRAWSLRMPDEKASCSTTSLHLSSHRRAAILFFCTLRIGVYSVDVAGAPPCLCMSLLYPLLLPFVIIYLSPEVVLSIAISHRAHIGSPGLSI